MRFISIIYLCGILAGGEAEASRLDRFNLTNGRALIGTVESETEDAYTIRLPAGQGGSIVVKKDRVVSVEKGAETQSTTPTVPVAEQRPAPREQPSAEAEAKDTAAAELRRLRSEATKKKALVTRDLFNLVKQQMPKAEALAILGAGFTVEPFNQLQPNGGQTYNWRNSNGSHVRVIFNRFEQVDRIDVMVGPAGRVELP